LIKKGFLNTYTTISQQLMQKARGRMEAISGGNMGMRAKEDE
jgi:hypothetical protein